jgi:hypothetical protein
MLCLLSDSLFFFLQKTKSGILLPDAAAPATNEATVLAVGSGARTAVRPAWLLRVLGALFLRFQVLEHSSPFWPSALVAASSLSLTHPLSISSHFAGAGGQDAASDGQGGRQGAAARLWRHQNHHREQGQYNCSHWVGLLHILCSCASCLEGVLILHGVVVAVSVAGEGGSLL